MAKKKKETEVEEVEDFGGVFVPDIPMPDAETNENNEIVEDECDAAFNLAFVGAGQAGARMVESFWKLGYRRVCAVNTTSQDLSYIDIPEENKLVMDIGEAGAGKDRTKGQKAITEYYEDAYDLMRRSFGKKLDKIIVCCGTGGGTGGGSVDTLIKIAHDIAESFGLEEKGSVPAVGALAAMPMKTEGAKVNNNATEVLESLFEQSGKHKGKLGGRTLSPLLVVDNDKISDLYPGIPAGKFWEVANQSISSLFHLFNSIATKDSEITTFDRADLGNVLEGGIITFGATPLAKWDLATDISYAIRDNLKKNILVGDIDLSNSNTAACVFIGHPEVLDEIPQENLEHGFQMLSRIMAENAVIHRGIYKGGVKGKNGKGGLVVYTLIGETGIPEKRMKEIYRIANKEQK